MKNNLEIPTIVIGNIAETFVDFLERCDDPVTREELINSEAFLCDRTLVWAGDPKLVIGSYPIAHQGFITEQLGFHGTTYYAPQIPTHYLCRDIANDPNLIAQILEYAGPKKRVQLIPYATTPEFLDLAELLREKYSLTVNTPESPDRDHLWIRDYIDTKAGFRQLVGTWLPEANRYLPMGVTCTTSRQAGLVVRWFNAKGKACLVKANTGENGIGIKIYQPGHILTLEEIVSQINADSYYSDDVIVVEECIVAQQQVSPSLEVFVPHLGAGEPEVTYLSKQLFLEFGDFCGIEVSKYLYEEPWYESLRKNGLIIANRLQEMGYAGHFDLDCIVDDNGQLYLLEINSRRTGGTHVHDLAYHIGGQAYIDKLSLLSFEAMSSETISNASELTDAVREFLYPLNGDQQTGLVITVTTTLQYHRFGCLTIAPTPQQALELQKRIGAKIKKYCETRPA